MVAPKSKAQIGPWYERTVLRRLWGLAAQHFTSQRFWEAMDHLDDATLQDIEAEVVGAAVAQFGVQVNGLIYDATNFFTYIGPPNLASLPQRGHNKQKRGDLSPEVRRAGIGTGMDRLLETLSGIRGVIDLPRQGSRNKSVPVAIRLTRRDPEQERLFQSLGLQRFHPEPPRTKAGTTPA